MLETNGPGDWEYRWCEDDISYISNQLMIFIKIIINKSSLIEFEIHQISKKEFTLLSCPNKYLEITWPRGTMKKET